MRRVHVLVAIVGFAVIAGACGDDDATATTVTTAAPPATTVAPSTAPPPPSSTAPPTTPAPTTTTTTTTMAPLDPGTFLVTSGICTLGWWDGDWQSGDGLPVTGGEEYQVVRLDEPITTSVGSAPTTTCEPLELTSVLLDPDPSVDYFDVDPIAIQTESDVRPHNVEMLGLDLPAYIDATTALLTTRGVVDPVINIEQVIRTDLEGDGTNEVIVAASTIDPGDVFAAGVGDYTLVYLRKVVQGEVQTAILVDEIITSLDQLPFGAVRYRVSAVADLNGDGKMEIVLSSEVWEGASVEAWEYVNDDLGPVQVHTCGCGV